MNLWLDAQLSPTMAPWIAKEFPILAYSVRDLGLRDAEDRQIFEAAKTQNAIVMTKDHDFVLLLERFGPPPKIIWLTCGNTSNRRLQEILRQTFQDALALLEQGEQLVEINAQN